MPHFKVGFATDIGRKRQQNQDSGTAQPDLGLFVVADGMGGHQGGETASAMVVDIMPGEMANRLRGEYFEPREALQSALRTANREIFQRALRQPDLHGMGTTTTALFFRNQTLLIAHVGDSRCYYLRPGALWQVTRDHSFVQEKLRAGLITREQLKTDRMKNVITRSVGFENDVLIDLYEMGTQPGDTFLICSDGLTGLVEDDQILSIVQRQLFDVDDIQKATDALVAAANANGGDDNITAILVQVLA